MNIKNLIVLVTFLFSTSIVKGNAQILTINAISLDIQEYTSADTIDLTVLPEEKNKPAQQQMLYQYLKKEVHQALDARKHNIEQVIKIKDSIQAYQESKQKLFLKNLGGFPEKTPLNARVIEEITYDDYRLQKVMYESRPDFHVPALYYLPKNPEFEAPYPGVVVLCGHNADGKAYEPYQKISILLAKHGFAVVCPDPLGQGERKQILDQNGAGKFGATLEHNITGVAPILLGKSLANYMTWDGIRAVDYLASRDEVDASRIGATGISGGGNRVSYLMAIDDRVKAAAPGCFITTIKRKNESPGPGDIEQNIHGQIAAGIGHQEYLHMRAPMPTQILSATLDFVPIEGAWESFREGKRLYSRMGYGDHIGLTETYAGHGYSQRLRESATAWMTLWLRDENIHIDEGEIATEPAEKLLVAPEGQVLQMENARSIFDINRQKYERLAGKRNEFLNNPGKNEIRRKIREISGIRNLEDIPSVRYEGRGKIERDGYQIKKVVLWPSEELAIPGLLFEPDDATGDPYLYLNEAGKNQDAGPGGPIEDLVKEGNTVLAVDLRGMGETEMKPWRYQSSTPYLGKNLAEFINAYRLGESFVGMRAEDILTCTRYLRQLMGYETSPGSINVIAKGKAGPPALHAVALEEALFGNLTLKNSLVSWESVINIPVTRDVMVNVVHEGLGYYDLPDLVNLLGQNKVEVINPVDAEGKPVSP